MVFTYLNWRIGGLRGFCCLRIQPKSRSCLTKWVKRVCGTLHPVTRNGPYRKLPASGSRSHSQVMLIIAPFLFWASVKIGFGKLGGVETKAGLDM